MNVSSDTHSLLPDLVCPGEHSLLVLLAGADWADIVSMNACGSGWTSHRNFLAELGTWAEHRKLLLLVDETGILFPLFHGTFGSLELLLPPLFIPCSGPTLGLWLAAAT